MIKDNMVMNGLQEQDDYTFPSPMMLRYQAIQSACSFQRKYWIGALVGLMLIIAGIVSAVVIVASKDSKTSTPEPEPSSKT